VPVQFEVVGVSLANQYRVWPCALTSTVPMLVLRVPMTTELAVDALLDGGLLDGVLGGVELLELGELLPQAASAAAATPASKGAAQYRFVRMTQISVSWPDTFL
jgi:hypothetical protein